MGKKITIEAMVRYPEDADVNGVRESESNPTMPFLFKDSDEDWIWRIEIDTDNGKICNWPNGTTASVFYKVCDCCKVIVDGNTVYDDYVPLFLDISEDGFGDYIYIDIIEDGRILDWDKNKCHAFLEGHGVLINETEAADVSEKSFKEDGLPCGSGFEPKQLVSIPQSTLDLVWDCMNEAVLGCPEGPWKNHAKGVLKAFEDEYEKAGFKLPISANGRATNK